MPLLPSNFIELLGHTIPLLVVQVINNMALGNNWQSFEQASLALSCVCVLIFFVEQFLSFKIKKIYEKSFVQAFTSRPISKIKEILIVILLTIVISVAVILSINLAISQTESDDFTCPMGKFIEGKECLSCADVFGATCNSCEGPEACTGCAEGY